MTDTTPPVLIEVERDDNGRVLVCTGCGTVETVRSIKARSGTAFTCCPERKMVPAWNTRANADARLVEALREARTELSITRTNIMCEINRCADPRDSRWEGVPEILKERIAKIDAALSEVSHG